MNPYTHEIPSTSLIYRRVSTHRQDASIEAQETLCSAYVARLGNVTAPEVFDDIDTSGGVAFLERPGGRALMARLESLSRDGKAANVVAAKLDRLGRDTLDVIGTIRRIWDLGHLPHLLEGGMFPKNPSNQFNLEVRASAAQLERGMIRERITTVLRHKRSQGRVVGTVPYGWRAVGEAGERFLEEDPAQAEVLRWMIGQRAPKAPFQRLTLTGPGWGYDRIATWLNRNNHRSRAAHGGWNPGHVHSILNNAYTFALAERIAATPAAA